MLPERQVEFSADLQYALHYEGRDLTDDEAYRHLLKKYAINEDDFYLKMKNEKYKVQAYYEFDLCRQLQVKAFPVVLLQLSDTKFHLLARGYTPYDELVNAISSTLESL